MAMKGNQMNRFIVDTIEVVALIVLFVAVMFGFQLVVELYARLIVMYAQAMTDLVNGL